MSGGFREIEERGIAARNSRACQDMEGMLTECTVHLRFQNKRKLLKWGK